jgi:hypothetical protein
MSIAHTDVGAYALGLLEDDDKRAFEEHLSDCGSCTAELESFAGMKALLEGVEPVELERPGEAGDHEDDLSAGVTDLLNRRRQAERRRRRATAVIGLAAGIALVAGGVTVGSAVVSPGGGHHHGSPAADVLAKGQLHSATSPTTRAKGIVALRPADFGTEIGLDLANVRGPLTCRLVAVTRSGQQQAVTEWGVPPKGYGVPGSPKHLQVHGGIAARGSDIARFDVLVEGGGTLVSIPV